MKQVFATIALLMAAAPTAAAPSPQPVPASAPGALTMCDALATEMDVIGARTEGQMIAMGQRLATEAATAIAENKAYNTSQSITGRLNWVAPGLGSALDAINKMAMKSSQRARELRMDRERVAATLSVQQAVDRMVALSNEMILNDCAQL